MKLASADKVLLTMGLPSTEGSLANAAQALEVSYPIIENLLETTFTQEGRTDFFDVIEGELFYRLTNMLVDPETVVVRRSLDNEQLITALDGEIVDPSEYHLDAAKGIVSLRHRQKAGACTLSVHYESGLGESDEPEVLASPQWLMECGVAVAVHVLNTLPSSPANRKDKSVAAVSTEIRLIASRLLNGRARPRMTVQFPVASLLDE